MAEARAPQIVNLPMPDGTVRQWDMANEPKPDSVGNGSRNGFLYNCYTHPLGRFFQETIKKGFLSVLKRIEKEIGRYDKTPFVYDDPRLKNLDQIIDNALKVHINDNDAERKREIAAIAKNITMFHMKEDIFYRFVILKIIQDIAQDAIKHPELYSLTYFEQYRYEWCNSMDGVSCHTQNARFPKFDEWLKLKGITLPQQGVS